MNNSSPFVILSRLNEHKCQLTEDQLNLFFAFSKLFQFET